MKSKGGGKYFVSWFYYSQDEASALPQPEGKFENFSSPARGRELFSLDRHDGQELLKPPGPYTLVCGANGRYEF